MKIKKKDNISWQQDQITDVFVLYIQHLPFPKATTNRVLRTWKLVDYAKKIIKSSHVVLSSCLANKEQEKY